ncbi:uncharacterized protein C8Q71DRAFT_214648 [Rhodofomes roseus]|uniref:Uncharacterized protein n=1 Tax=Rhodofomes roseus TaxID=34475 RepID=A0ABQ8KUA8_9APHY|nr:uncharacterized protein C8Q71DRAFT_214648 [Rhodofomes roseus]KAH9842662.1 hypothetical protein C8Q71DRAFT_214648 [Rhodofomes roseus]
MLLLVCADRFLPGTFAEMLYGRIEAIVASRGMHRVFDRCIAAGECGCSEVRQRQDIRRYLAQLAAYGAYFSVGGWSARLHKSDGQDIRAKLSKHLLVVDNCGNRSSTCVLVEHLRAKMMWPSQLGKGRVVRMYLQCGGVTGGRKSRGELRHLHHRHAGRSLPSAPTCTVERSFFPEDKFGLVCVLQYSSHPAALMISDHCQERRLVHSIFDPEDSICVP